MCVAITWRREARREVQGLFVTLRASGNAPEGGRETALFGVRFWASKKVPLGRRGRYRPAINNVVNQNSFI